MHIVVTNHFDFYLYKLEISYQQADIVNDVTDGLPLAIRIIIIKMVVP
jgi:hypothetical protein